MNAERIVRCNICEGIGKLPVECISPSNEFPRRYAPSTRVTQHFACGNCGGKGEVLAVVSDEPDRSDWFDWFDEREAATIRREMEHDTR